MKAYLRFGAVILFGAGAASADLAEVSQDIIAPSYGRFAVAAADLDAAAQQDCSAEALRDPYQAAWDAWAGIDYFHLGPIEENGRSLSISFWPDPKSAGQRTQQGLIDTNAALIGDPLAFAKISVAARGLGGMERLIYPGGVAGEESVICRLRQATAADLSRQAAEVVEEWPEFETLLLTAGEPGNETYLTEQEAVQAVYTQLVTGLEYLADVRLGRPLGTEEQPRPERAESLAAGRSLRNIRLSLEAQRDIAQALQPDAPDTQAAFDRAISLADALDDPVLAGVAEPESRARIVALQQAIRAAKRAAEREIGAALGLSVGFNSRDGD